MKKKLTKYNFLDQCAVCKYALFTEKDFLISRLTKGPLKFHCIKYGYNSNAAQIWSWSWGPTALKEDCKEFKKKDNAKI